MYVQCDQSRYDYRIGGRSGMEYALSTLMVVWGLIGLVTLWVAANALADFGARRFRHWYHTTRSHPHTGDE